MTSQIAFMDHNPLTVATMENSISSFVTFLQSFLYSPRIMRHTQCEAIISPSDRSFIFKFGEQAWLKGHYFRSPGDTLAYFRRRGIAADWTKYDFDLIATSRVNRHQVPSYYFAIFEEFRYEKDTDGIVPPSVRNRVQALLTEATTKMPLFLWKNKQFVHQRTGELIPEDTWIPLYRNGEILESSEEPFNLDRVKHVIY